MRIIAGEARGRTLVASKGMDTRPTQDHVRESLFNILRNDTAGARVLDLFAGSGALALEALSRGAESAVLVDSALPAVQCVQRNVETLRAQQRTQVLHSDWKAALARLNQTGRAFSLVFLDPPYRITGLTDVFAALADQSLLEPGALVVAEHRAGTPPQPDGRFTQRDARRYGDTEIRFYTYTGGEQAHESGPVRIPGQL